MEATKKHYFVGRGWSLSSLGPSSSSGLATGAGAVALNERLQRLARDTVGLWEGKQGIYPPWPFGCAGVLVGVRRRG